MYLIFKHSVKKLKTFFIKIYLQKNHIQFDGLPLFSGSWPHFNNEGEIAIGINCSFRSFRIRQHFTVFKNAKLEIGDGSFLNDGINLCAAKSIKIGHHTMIGDMTTIYDTDFHQISPDLPMKLAPVIIGNNVWIGTNVMILPGAVIGDHSVIAAGSIVTGEIPTKSLAAGSPARVIKTLGIPDDWLRK